MTSAAPRDAQRALERCFRDDRAAVLATVARRVRDLQLAEDAVQDAFAAAAQHWPGDGIPARPAAWLTTTAWRKALDAIRRDRSTDIHSRLATPPSRWPTTDPPLDEAAKSSMEIVTCNDDLLALVLLCCHPALSLPSQVALTLRHVAGLNDTQAAARMLVTPAAMTKRLVRARMKIRDSGISFELPEPATLPARLDAARTVTYLLFTQGYSSSNLDDASARAQREDAIWLARQLHRLSPNDNESAGLLALLLLHHARSPARTDSHNWPIPHDAHDRTLYDQDAIADARTLLGRTTRTPRLGPYQVQAAIAVLHTTPTEANGPDWATIAALYEILGHLDVSPMITINYAVAAGRARGPQAGLRVLQPLLNQPLLDASVNLHAAHAHLLAASGDTTAAATAWTKASKHALSPPQRQYLRQLSLPTPDA